MSLIKSERQQRNKSAIHKEWSSPNNRRTSQNGLFSITFRSAGLLCTTLLVVLFFEATRTAAAAQQFLSADHVFIQQGDRFGNSFEGQSGSGVAITADGKTLFVSNWIGEIAGEYRVGMLVDTRDEITDGFVLDIFILAMFDPNENETPAITSTTKIAASDDGSTVAIISMTFTHEFVHILTGPGWTKNQTFALEETTATTRMIPSIAVSGDGQTVVFGSGAIPLTPAQPNCVHVFQLGEDDEWIDSLLPLDDVETDEDIESRRCEVAISATGSTILVGIPWMDQGDGGALVYLKNDEDGTYSQAMKLVPLDSATGVGDQLAINREGNLAIVFSQTADAHRGAFWAFQQNTSVPEQWFPLVGMFTIQDPDLLPSFTESDIYGPLVATMGPDETIAIGRNNFKSNKGAVWLFRRKEGAVPSWEQLGQRLEPVGETSATFFGLAVSFSNEGTLIVSGRENGIGGTFYVFHSAKITPSPTASPTEANVEPGNEDLIIIIASSAGSIGGLVLITVLGAMIIYCRRRRRYLAVATQTPTTLAFLTHEWGDDSAHKNHQRVGLVNEELKKLKVPTWFDTDKLSGDIVNQIVAGIDKTSFVVIFLTKRYMEKVGKLTAANIDYSQMEFQYSVRRRGRDRIIVVVMEPELLDSRKWFGPIGALLGNALYIDFTKDENAAQVASEIYREIIKRQQAANGGAINSIAVTAAADNPKFSVV